jgi:hypothetical protein
VTNILGELKKIEKKKGQFFFVLGFERNKLGGGNDEEKSIKN